MAVKVFTDCINSQELNKLKEIALKTGKLVPVLSVEFDPHPEVTAALERDRVRAIVAEEVRKLKKNEKTTKQKNRTPRIRKRS